MNFFITCVYHLKMTCEGHATGPFPLFTDFSLFPMPQLKGYSAHVHMHVYIKKSTCVCRARLSGMHWITTNICMGNHHVSSAVAEPEVQAIGFQDCWPEEAALDGLGLLSCGLHMQLGASSAYADQPAWEDLLTPFQPICMGLLTQGSDWDIARPRRSEVLLGPCHKHGLWWPASGAAKRHVRGDRLEQALELRTAKIWAPLPTLWFDPGCYRYAHLQQHNRAVVFQLWKAAGSSTGRDQLPPLPNALDKTTHLPANTLL